MTRRRFGLFGTLFMLGAGVLCAGSNPVWAMSASFGREEVTVDDPYTIRQQVVPRSPYGQMQEMRIEVEKNISFSDLDLTKVSDLQTLRHRIRQAAVENCREIDRRFPHAIYYESRDSDCVKGATSQALARLYDNWPSRR